MQKLLLWEDRNLVKHTFKFPAFYSNTSRIEKYRWVDQNKHIRIILTYCPYCIPNLIYFSDKT